MSVAVELSKLSAVAREALLEALRDNQDPLESLLLVVAGNHEHATKTMHMDYEPFYAWTKRHVYFVSEYDGTLTVHSVMNKPDKNEIPNYH